jgi:hypothetical protein
MKSLKRICISTLFLLASSLTAFTLYAQTISFPGPELLGRPTANSVTVNVVANRAIEAYFECGLVSGAYTDQTTIVSAAANAPIEAVIDGLTADTQYYYRMVYRAVGNASWLYRNEHSFRTQRAPGAGFTFTLIADSHLGQYGGQTANERALYQRTLLNVRDDKPDFHIDLGDTFAMDPSPLGSGMTETEAAAAYMIQRPFMGLISGSVPIFLVIGNHENEEGWNFDDVFKPPDQSLAHVGMKYRKLLYPNPVPDNFYSGNTDPLPQAIGGDTNREDYYAWEWGDALFVVLDPCQYSMVWPAEGGSYGGEGTDGEARGTRWDWTLGIKQYLWFKNTLENSHARYKFVFSHHVTGGATPYGRGGLSAARYFEWGGRNADGTWGWDARRPASEGWDVPVHQLMVANHVTAYFHGHDHIYAREMLDGILYLEVPKPDDAGYAWQPYGYGYTEGLYPDALMIQNSGHVRVNVSPTGVTVDYVRSYLPGNGTNGVVADTVSLSNAVPSVNVSLNAGGAATVSTAGSSGSTQAGYATLAMNSGISPYATAVFSLNQNGVTVTEMGIPASPPTNLARVFIDWRSAVLAVPANASGGLINVNTGIAVVNPGAAPANVTYTLRDYSGSILSIGTGTIAPGKHFACFIDELKVRAEAQDFNLPADFPSEIQFGSLEISSSQPVSVLGLRGTMNQRDEFLMTTTPIADLTHPLNKNPIYFPQFVDGGGYTTSILLLNTSSVFETGTLEITNGKGEPFVVNTVGGIAGSRFSYWIPPGGVHRFQTDGSPADVNAGWVRLTPDEGTWTPIGSGVFSYNPEHILVSESGIPSAASTTHARIFMDLSRNHSTGLALANLVDAPAEIRMKAYSIDGIAPMGEAPVALDPNGHAAAFVDEIIKPLPAEFTGVLEISSETPFAALTVRTLINERHEFLMTTFPVADQEAEAPSPIVFPQVADGGGYVTQLIFISPTSESTATLDFRDETGAPLPIGK